MAPASTAAPLASVCARCGSPFTPPPWAAGEAECRACYLHLAPARPNLGAAPSQRACPNRDHLAAILAAQPGLTFRGLVQSSGLASGTVRHHLSTLQRRGLAWERRVGSTLRLFAGPKPDEVEADRLARQACVSAPERAILRVLAERGSTNQSGVLDAYPGVPRSTTQHRLGRLVRLGLIKTRPSGRLRFYELAPSA